MKNMEKRWIEPDAYAISREEYAKDRIVRDVIYIEEKMMSLHDCLLALQRMATREREKYEKANLGVTTRKHRATAELFEAVMFYLRAKNEVIAKMKT
jgi:hypothetical protein